MATRLPPLRSSTPLSVPKVSATSTLSYGLTCPFTHVSAENETYYRELEERHNELVGETVEVGLLFASKAIVQLLVNPIVGPLTHR